MAYTERLAEPGSEEPHLEAFPTTLTQRQNLIQPKLFLYYYWKKLDWTRHEFRETQHLFG